ncbi:MAG: BamA/TamA family outer membrane protein, partial [Bacteroidota bacterium]
KAIEEIQKNHKHVIDQTSVLRARLFDVWIGDWDRHDDQWRWATFKADGVTTYRPVPRDRDQVFFKNDGVLDFIASRPYFNPGLRHFKSDVDFYPGLIFNARHFDRTFLHQLTRQEFIDMAKDLQSRLSDEVIEKAFAEWPTAIAELNAEQIKKKLKDRRAKLVQFAEFHYNHISREVAVPGTVREDHFELTTLPNDQLEVKVYTLSKKDKKHLIYERVLSGKTTKEVQLFGLKKADQFLIKGEHRSSIKVRIIGGSGEDRVDNQTTKNKILVYDRPQGMQLAGNKVRSKITDQDGVNKYDRKDWKQNRFIHFPMATFYIDAGLGLSYNIWWKKFGFRSNPYRSDHRLSFAYFWANQAIRANYSGHFPKAIGNLDFKLDLEAIGPTFTQFFYGLGNEYVNFDQDNAFHIVRGTRIDINPQLIKPFRFGRSFRVNPSFEYLNLRDSDDDPRFVLTPEGNRTPLDFEEKYYVGLGIGYNATRLDNPVIPSRGFSFDVSADYKLNTQETDFSNVTFAASLASYLPFNQRKTVVLATNVGGAYTFGDYEFFHANYLATISRLRGFRINRFGGDGMIYHATDLRVKVAHGKGAFPFGFGVFGAFDYGRVWLEEDPDGQNAWHTSFGGGLFFTPLDMLGFKIGYFVGEDDTQINIGGAMTF